MSHGAERHPKTSFTPSGRRRMVGCVLERRLTVRATAGPLRFDAKTIRELRDRFPSDVDTTGPYRAKTECQPHQRPRDGLHEVRGYVAVQLPPERISAARSPVPFRDCASAMWAAIMSS